MYIPPEFFGLNSQDWPTRAPTSGGDGASAPAFDFGMYSTHDCSTALNWGALHTASNTVDWTKLDATVAALQAHGVTKGLYALHGTPTFLAQPAQAAVSSTYGPLGGGSYPTDLSQLAWFCQQFAARNASVWSGFFTAVQILNEPEANDFAGTTVGQWWGTRKEFVNFAATAYAALKAADASLVVLSAGTYRVTTLSAWCGETGDAGAGSGVYGHQCFDAVATHPYWATPNHTYSGHGTFDSVALGGVRPIRSAMAAFGKADIDIWCTEWGLDSGGSRASPSATCVTFMAQTAEYRRQYTERLFIGAALAGLKNIFLFSYGGPFLSGDLVTDTDGVVLGAQNAYTAMAGKTWTSGGYYPDGRAWISFADGGTYVA